MSYLRVKLVDGLYTVPIKDMTTADDVITTILQRYEISSGSPMTKRDFLLIEYEERKSVRLIAPRARVKPYTAGKRDIVLRFKRFPLYSELPFVDPDLRRMLYDQIQHYLKLSVWTVRREFAQKLVAIQIAVDFVPDASSSKTGRLTSGIANLMEMVKKYTPTRLIDGNITTYEQMLAGVKKFIDNDSKVNSITTKTEGILTFLQVCSTSIPAYGCFTFYADNPELGKDLRIGVSVDGISVMTPSDTKCYRYNEIRWHELPSQNPDKFFKMTALVQQDSVEFSAKVRDWAGFSMLFEHLMTEARTRERSENSRH